MLINFKSAHIIIKRNLELIMDTINSEPLFENPVIKDFNYFRGIYSKASSYLSNEIKKAVDDTDNVNSFIYDAYPDKVTLNIIVDKIASQMEIPETELWIKPLIEVLLYQDIIIRRCNKLILLNEKNDDETN